MRAALLLPFAVKIQKSDHAMQFTWSFETKEGNNCSLLLIRFALE